MTIDGANMLCSYGDNCSDNYIKIKMAGCFAMEIIAKEVCYHCTYYQYAKQNMYPKKQPIDDSEKLS